MNSLSLAFEIEGLADLIVKPSALLLIAVGVTHLMSRASAAARHLVWSAALAGALLLPVLSSILPGLRVPLPADASSSIASEFTPATAADAGFPSASVADGAPSGVFEDTSIRPDSIAVAGVRWTEWVLLFWLVGTLLVAGRLVLSVVGVWRLARRATMVTDGAWLDLAHDLARRLGSDRGITLMQGEGGRVPMTWGVFRPVIWIPAEAAAWPQERRAVVLAHELAHVRRRDALTQWAGHLAIAVYWFNPLVWMAARRLYQERERACDDAVLRMGTPAARYADHLLQIAQSIGVRTVPGAAMAMARPSNFEGRVRAILDRSTPRDSVGTAGIAFIGVLALGCILSVAALRAEAATGTAPEVASVIAAGPFHAIPPQTQISVGSGEAYAGRGLPESESVPLEGKGDEADDRRRFTVEAAAAVVSTGAAEGIQPQSHPTKAQPEAALTGSSEESPSSAGEAPYAGSSVSSSSSSSSSSASSSATQQSESRRDGI